MVSCHKKIVKNIIIGGKEMSEVNLWNIINAIAILYTFYCCLKDIHKKLFKKSTTDKNADKRKRRRKKRR